MDSLTHVVLGAACGEILLGKKMGNRAMIWGSIAGSFPDFDVLAQFFQDPLPAMLFHRGPMHSLLFVLTMPFILGPLLKMLYDGNWHKRRAWKITGFIIGIILFALASLILCLIYNLLFDSFPWILMILLLATGIFFFYKRFQQIFKQETEIANVSSREWIKLILICMLIHPILDALTTYGTVLFWPFSNARIAISNIAIADPMYTLPFAVLVLFAALQQRNTSRRSLLNSLGMGYSCVYLLLTFINKNHINQLFQNSLKANHVPFKEYITVPTILNNVLWYGIAKQDSGYVFGYYSLFDKEKPFSDLQFIAGHHDYLKPYEGQSTAELLPWFSSGYYNVLHADENVLQYNDLRYGSMNGKMSKNEDYIFKFNLIVKNGILQMQEHQRGPDNRREDIEWFKSRIIGIKELKN